MEQKVEKMDTNTNENMDAPKAKFSPAFGDSAINAGTSTGDFLETLSKEMEHEEEGAQDLRRRKNSMFIKSQKTENVVILGRDIVSRPEMNLKQQKYSIGVYPIRLNKVEPLYQEKNKATAD